MATKYAYIPGKYNALSGKKCPPAVPYHTSPHMSNVVLMDVGSSCFYSKREIPYWIEDKESLEMWGVDVSILPGEYLAMHTV